MLSVGSAALLPLSSLLTGPLLARALGPEGRGEMAAVLAPLMVASFVVAAGLPEGAAYLVAKGKLSPRAGMTTSAPLLFVTGLVGSCLMWLFADEIVGGSPQVEPMFKVIVFTLPIFVVALSQRGVVLGAEWYGVIAVERAISSLGRLVLLVVLVLAGGITFATAAWTQVVATGAGVAYLVHVLLRRSTRSPDDLPFRQGAREVIGWGVRAWGSVYSKLISWRLDQAIMAGFVASEDLGYYAIAVSLAEIPGMIIGALAPYVFSQAANRSDLGLVARASRMILAFSVVTNGLLILATPLVVEVMFGSDFHPAVPLARILLVGNIFLTLDGVLGAGLFAAGRPGLRSVSQVVGAVITIVGLLVLIPAMGTTGAALVSLVAYAITSVITLALLARVAERSAADFLVLRTADISWFRGQVSRGLKRGRG